MKIQKMVYSSSVESHVRCGAKYSMSVRRINVAFFSSFKVCIPFIFYPLCVGKFERLNANKGVEICRVFQRNNVRPLHSPVSSASKTCSAVLRKANDTTLPLLVIWPHCPSVQLLLKTVSSSEARYMWHGGNVYRSMLTDAVPLSIIVLAAEDIQAPGRCSTKYSGGQEQEPL